MEKIITFSPAWDKRNSDPGKNYGVHGVEVKFVLKGRFGATQFVIYTNWQLPHVQEWHNSMALKRGSVDTILPMAADFGYHAPAPQYKDQPSYTDACEYLDGKPCYYDGSGLYAEEVYKKLLSGGDSAVWEELEASYKERFGELE